MNEEPTPNAIKIYGTKNINKPGKKLQFDDFNQREYWVNPIGFEYSDPHERLIFFENNLVFKIPGNGAIGFDAVMEKIK
jgi:hypothetical protein